MIIVNFSFLLLRLQKIHEIYIFADFLFLLLFRQNHLRDFLQSSSGGKVKNYRIKPNRKGRKPQLDAQLMSFNSVNTFQQYSSHFGLGHNGVKVSFNFFDGIPESSLVNSLASNELKLIFKLLLKRDETTKEKALADLLKLLDDFPENESLFANDIFSLCWSQVYPKLLLSNSKSIRIQSHQLTSTLIKVLHKKVAKFLKDFIPLLLLGTCDSDTVVSKSCSTFISGAFNQDSKKINALWALFHEDVLNLIREVVLDEHEGTVSDERYTGQEDSQLRYNRLLTGTIFLLRTLIESDEKAITSYKATYRDILSSESLWNLLNLKNTLFLKSYDVSIQLLQLLYRIEYLKSHKDVFKMSVRKLLKSLVQINSKNILKVSNLMVTIIDTLTLLDEYKDGRIWAYDKGSKEKLLAFLSVCCKNSHPGFFPAMYRFYQRTATHDLLSYELEWIPLWKKSITSLNERSFLGRHGATLLGECWTYFLKFTNDTEDASVKKLIQSKVVETLCGERSLAKLPALRTALKDVLPQDFIIREVENDLKVEHSGSSSKSYLPNLTVLLIDGTETGDSLKSLTVLLLHAINQDIMPDDSRKMIMELYLTLIKADIETIAPELSLVISCVPKMVSQATYDILAAVMTEYSKVKTTQKSEVYFDSLESFFIAAVSCQITDERILNTLNALSGSTRELLIKSATLTKLINDYIDNYKYDDGGKIFQTPLLSNAITVRLYESAKANNLTEKFCDAALNLDLHQKEYLLNVTDFLSASMFKKSKACTQKAFEIVKPFINRNREITERLCNTVIQHAKTKGSKDEDRLYVDYAVNLINESQENVPLFFPANLIELFVASVPCIDNRLAMINCLGLNTHLLPTSQDELNLDDIEKLIKFALFLDTLCSEIPSLLNGEVSVFLTMVSELVEDFNSLSCSPDDHFNDVQNSLLKSNTLKISADSIITALTDNSESYKEKIPVFHDMLADGCPSVVEFYSFRVIYKMLLNEVDCMTVSLFNRLLPSIEHYVSNVVRSENSKNRDYMSVAVILSALSNFAAETSFMKLRNLLAAECIGSKVEEIYVKTFKVIILLNNLISDTKEHGLATLIAPQRLNMMLKTVGQWLDSDVSYDTQFGIINVILLRFFSSLVSNPFTVDANPVVIEMSTRLLTDCLSMCELEDTTYLSEIRFYCLGLYSSASNLIPAEYETDILTCIVELCLTDFPFEENNQLSVSFYKALNKIVSQLDRRSLLDYYDSFLDSFLNKTNIKNFNRIRLLTGILQILVKEKQQEAVIEYELRKESKQKSQGDMNAEAIEDFEEDSNADTDFKLPQILIEKLEVEVPRDYLEYENEYSFLKYLWYWNLVMQFFDTSSYNLRQLFIEQLKTKDLIFKFFDFVSDQIDLQENKFWATVGTDGIINYDVFESEFSPYREEVFVECKRLLAHSLYRMFDNVGSLTASWWLNIKDRSFQTKIEQFTSKFISPILIRHELDTVASKMDSLTSKDDALSIKINTVTDEVKATYLIDEQKLEISFKLPNNYPLTNIEVIGISRVGISEQKWKQWILSTQRVITGMNGSVMDSLELFTKNVNLQFSGFEECAICYSILHAVDRKLPTKICPTCNNKFHGACLYKWFRSSGNNTCPLCRSEIPFRR